MSRIFWLLVLTLVVQDCYAPPVSQNQKESESEEAQMNGLEDYMEYHRYLKEVVSALESDPEFRQKLEKADTEDIKSGKIANELEFVSHHVRTRLDEIKRVELERLKELTEKKLRLEDPSNAIDDDPLHHHVDHNNPHTFEIEDLKKLIRKTTEDLAEADKMRKEQFKQYEMEKEYKKQDRLNHTTGEQHEELEKKYKEVEEKHKNHEKLHEPGHKAQLEEVWEEQDQMQQDFDPKTFFMLHDIDGNGLWDQNEVKALFIKELDKMYQKGAPEDDIMERYEEMERMRESVFMEMDKNRDGFIDYNEFIHQTNTAEFKEDHGWKALDEQRPFTDEELQEYIRQHESAQMGHPQGYPQQVPAGAYQQVPPGAYQMPGGYQQPIPPGGYQQVAPGGYQQVPPAGYQHVPPGGYQQQVPPGGYQQQAPPRGYPQQVPPGGYQQQVPPGGYQQQLPPGGYQQVNKVPLGSHQAELVQQQGQSPDQLHLNTNEIHPQQIQQHGVQSPQNTNQQQKANLQHQQVNLQQPPQQINQQPLNPDNQQINQHKEQQINQPNQQQIQPQPDYQHPVNIQQPVNPPQQQQQQLNQQQIHQQPNIPVNTVH